MLKIVDTYWYYHGFMLDVPGPLVTETIHKRNSYTVGRHDRLTKVPWKPTDPHPYQPTQLIEDSILVSFPVAPLVPTDENKAVEPPDDVKKKEARTWFFKESGLTPEEWLRRVDSGTDVSGLVVDEDGQPIPLTIITDAARSIAEE